MGAASSVLAVDPPPGPAAQSARKPKSFPRMGVRFSAFQEFVEACGGAAKLEGLTTKDVVDRHIKPMTSASKLSFCDTLARRRHKAVARPTVYVSHAWSQLFLEVHTSLKEHFQGNDVVLWMDIFSMNQHDCPQFDFHWWSHTLKCGIQQIGHFVQVLSPWDRPLALTRSWCIYECFCALDSALPQKRVEMVFPAKDRRAFFDNLHFPVAAQRLTNVDMDNSQCSKVAEKLSLGSAIRQTMGFAHINGTVGAFLRRWLIALINVEIDGLSARDSLRYVAQFTLGELYGMEGDYAAAKPMYIECIQCWVEALGYSHPNTLCAIYSLGKVYFQQGEVDKAEPLYVECLHRYEEQLGAAHLSTINSRHNLGLLYEKQGRLEQAEALYQQCCDQYRALRGDDDLLTVGAVSSLATLYNARGRFLQAEPLHALAVERFVLALGEKHVDTLAAKYSMATMYQHTGRPECAEPLFQDCLDGYKNKLGNDHPQALAVMTKLALVQEALGKHVRAEALHVEAVDGFKRRYGVAHHDALHAMLALAAFLSNRGDLSRSALLLSECVAQRDRVATREAQGDVHKALHALAGICYHQQRYGEAEQHYLACLEYNHRLLGELHADSLTTKHNLACLFCQTGRLAEAQVLHAECWAAHRAQLGAAHPTTVQALSELVLLHETMSQPDTAEQLLTAHLDHCKDALGPEHAATLQATAALVDFYNKHDRDDELRDRAQAVARFKQPLLADDSRPGSS